MHCIEWHYSTLCKNLGRLQTAGRTVKPAGSNCCRCLIGSLFGNEAALSESAPQSHTRDAENEDETQSGADTGSFKMKQKKQINKISRPLSAGEDKINLKCKIRFMKRIHCSLCGGL